MSTSSAAAAALLLRTSSSHNRTTVSSSVSSSLRTNTRSKEFGWTKHGFGKIQARCEPNTTNDDNNSNGSGMTHLTHISHQAPARCIPMQHRTTAAKGAICVLSNYGGGLVQGDRVDWDIHVQAGATLGLTTQGANRIYKHSQMMNDSKDEQQHPCSQTTLHATVESNALLVHAPDPVSCFQHSRYRQTSHIQLQHDTSTENNSSTSSSSSSQTSVCWMDWFSAGRVSRGERWQQSQLENCTTLEVLGEGNSKPFVCHDNTIVHSPHMGPFAAFGTLLLYGPQVQAVLQQCLALQSQLVSQHTRIRQHPLLLLRNVRDKEDRLPFLAGRCVVGVSQVETCSGLHMARFLTQSNEDMYRLLHQCLLPLQSHFQYAFYQDRLQSQHSAAVPEMATPWQVVPPAESTTTATTPLFSTQAQWLSYLLSDFSLPVGGFAHSAGLEAAHQLGLVPDVQSLEAYVHAVVHSTLHMVSPLVRAGHAWVQGPTCDDWNVYTEIQELAHAHLCSNEINCRVSLDQGRSLLRVFQSWKQQDDGNEKNDQKAAFSQIRRMYTEISTSNSKTGTTITPHHLAPVWGALTALFGVPEEEACQLLGYCVARDVVSAAVRMNLLGPMQSMELLARTRTAVQAGLSSQTLAGCAPLVDAIQPCHNVLSTRLFRS